MPENILLIYLSVLLVATLYSSVGHGGASGYLAIMSLFSMPIATLKPTALTLNIIVSLIAFIQFYRSGFFDKKLFLMLAVVSIPSAFLGGKVSIDPTYYKQLLGVFLFFASARLIIPFTSEKENQVNPSLPILLVIGASIGLLSGMLGIGGGIILSPVLIFLGYADVKTSAGISAAFIFVNSIAGLLGQIQQGISFNSSMTFMVALAVIGGIVGSTIGSKKLNQPIMKKVLAGVLIFAAMKLVFV